MRAVTFRTALPCPRSPTRDRITSGMTGRIHKLWRGLVFPRKKTRRVGAVDPLCLLVRLLSVFAPETHLLHHDFVARRVQSALYANPLAVELFHFILMVDIIDVPGVILQNILVALLGDGSRESLGISSARRCRIRRPLRSGLRRPAARSGRVRRLLRIRGLLL